MASKRNRNLCIISLALGTVILPAGLIAIVRQGSFAGVILVLAGAALLVQAIEQFS